MKASNRRARRRRMQSRKLRLQSLESRQLLAADAIPMHNTDLPEDVNADTRVTSLDALMVINEMRGQRGDQPAGGQQREAFSDVNGDGRITSLDALRVINRMRNENGRRNDSDRAPAPTEPVTDDPATENPPVDLSTEVRSIDGSGNNLDNPDLGTAGGAFRRLVEADYADGISEPAGGDRLSAREISNIVADQEESILSDRRLSDLVWQWGQFIDHDLDLTGEGDEAFNISVPTGDEFFDPFATGTQEIGLHRSATAEGTGVDSPREQVNEITAFIDGSMVYGSDAETAASLRSFEGGRLLTSDNDLLPTDENGFFLAGDVRVNEQSGLTAMHTLWVREHNRIADEIAAEHPEFSDEEIFQEARAIVIGEIQAITFNEYLPALLGRDAIPRYEGYDSTVDPTISNLFATAAFRYGHTTLSSELKRLDDEGNEIEAGHLQLRDAFFDPSHIQEEGIASLLNGLASNISQEIDNQLVDDVRNFLFGPPGAGGFDLAALNIQRGRDHGLPDYNAVREQLGLGRVESFADISSDPEVQANLEQAYGNVDNIDVWVGALAEDHLRGASVGEVIQAVLVEQFTALRDGDRFWYQNTFSDRQLREIDNTRLSDVIERNTVLTSLQDNAFVVPQESDRSDSDSRRRESDDGRRLDPDAPPPESPLVDDPVDTGTPLAPPPPAADADELAGDPSVDELPPPPPGEPQQGENESRRRRSRRDNVPPPADDANGELQAGLATEGVDQVFGDLGR